MVEFVLPDDTLVVSVDSIGWININLSSGVITSSVKPDSISSANWYNIIARCCRVAKKVLPLSPDSE